MDSLLTDLLQLTFGEWSCLINVVAENIRQGDNNLLQESVVSSLS